MTHQIMGYQQTLTPKEAAEYIGFAYSTLNNARYTGLMGGVAAPLYRKLGKSIRYEKASLDAWMSQFKEQTSTSENGGHYED